MLGIGGEIAPGGNCAALMAALLPKSKCMPTPPPVVGGANGPKFQWEIPFQ